MSVPKKKSPRSNKGHRRGHQQLAAVQSSVCPKCKHAKLSHQACPNCGYYRDRDVLDLDARLSKKERKKAAKERAKQTEEQAQAEPAN